MKNSIVIPGVFVFIKDENERILLVKDRNNKWGLPGGGIEQGEIITKTAKREVKEETGLDIETKRLIGIFSLEKNIGVVTLFEGHIVGGEIKPNGDGNEILICGAVNPQKIKKEIMHPAQWGLIQWALSDYAWPIFGNPIPPSIKPQINAIEQQKSLFYCAS